METQSKRDAPKWFRYLPVISGTLIVALVAAGLIWFVHGMLEKKTDGPKRQVAQVVKLIRPPPPPEQPPPPPPEKVEQPLPQDTPEPTPQPDALAEQLGVDADGSAGGDGFGLAARKGGRDLLASGAGAFAWYTSMVSSSIRDCLSEDNRVLNGTYTGEVRVWIANDSRVERVKLIRTTGNQNRDSAIEEDITKKCPIRAAPPIEMPQPITFRVGSRG